MKGDASTDGFVEPAALGVQRNAMESKFTAPRTPEEQLPHPKAATPSAATGMSPC
jgi:hypothetical protein